MTEALINHLWQSTLCVPVAALLTLAFRENGARVRFCIWFTASVKFLVPFAMFVWIGRLIPWPDPPAGPASAALSIAMDQIVEPATLLTANLAATPAARAALELEWSGWIAVLSIWLAGAIVLLCRRVYQWLYVLAIAKTSSALDLEAPIPVRETSSPLEPGVFGIISPVLLLPAGFARRLTPAQFDAILTHELCHWQRRDNLTAAIHMLVELLFWFHPLVWWLGGRLIDERERACDEKVIQSGSDRHAYAEGLLRVCQRYVESPACSAGVSGGTLQKRIEDIMTNPVVGKLPLVKKCMLATAALVVTAGPLTVGAVSDFDAASGVRAVQMKHYRNEQWRFELSIPRDWTIMPLGVAKNE